MKCVAAALFGLAVVAGCSVVSEPTPEGNCPRSPERVARVEQLLVIGHRGAAGKEVENTIPSMARAVADGANAVEIDLSLTKDGVVVLWHDWDPDDAEALARQSDKEPDQHARPRVPEAGDPLRRQIDELTLAELRGHYGYAVDDRPAMVEIPTLDQFLDWADGASALAYVLFDLKIPAAKADLAGALIGKVRAAMEARGSSFAHVFLTPHEAVYEKASTVIDDDALSFDVDPGVVIADGAACEDSSSERAVRRGRGYASTVAPGGIPAEAWDTLQELLSCDLTARDKQTPPIAPKKVFVATINDREQLECLLDMGLDGIVTDDPAGLTAIAIERGRLTR
jgi:glycerophosphoryl diester phosphodiesterase